jgi:hypothetical protein
MKSEVPSMAGYTRSVGITVSPHVVAWIPAVCLTVVFVMTFFPWVGCYTGGSAVYSQRPWGAMFGSSPYRNFRLEAAGTIPGGWLDNMPSDWKVLLPCFLVLLVALSFAWSERCFRSFEPRSVPPLVKLWPWRNAIVGGGSAIVLMLLLVQWGNGFGMERAIRQHISERFADRREKAGTSQDKLATLEYDEEQAFGAYNVEHTSWMYLALLAAVVAVGAVGIRAGLDGRAGKPPPKILLHY